MSCAHPKYSQPVTLGLSTKGHLNPCSHRELPALLLGCPLLSPWGRRGGRYNGVGGALPLSPPFIFSAASSPKKPEDLEGEMWWQSQVLLTFLNSGSRSISSQDWDAGGGGSWGCSGSLWLQPPWGKPWGSAPSSAGEALAPVPDLTSCSLTGRGAGTLWGRVTVKESRRCSQHPCRDGGKHLDLFLTMHWSLPRGCGLGSETPWEISPSLLGRRKSASARELGGAHAGGSPGNRRYQLQHVAWEAGSWFRCPKLITQVPELVLLLWQSWGASSELSAASPGRPAALPTLPSWTTVLPVLASGRWRKGTSYWEDAPAVHSRAQDHPAAFQKGLGTHVTQPTVLLTWHSPACPWWRPAGTLCPRRSPSPCPGSPWPVLQHLCSSLGFPWHKSLYHPRHLRPQPGESGMSLSPVFQIRSVCSHPGCSGWSSC